MGLKLPQKIHNKGASTLKIEKKQNRFFNVNKRDLELDEENLTVTFPFSSEQPVERWFGMEILSHDAGSCDMARMNDGGACLWNHNWDQQIGVVEKCELRSDKRLWATVRFSKNNPQAVQVWKDIVDGIIRNVSFGYEINPDGVKLLNPQSDDPPQYLITRWGVYEISFAPVPADPTVGVGRSHDGAEEVIVAIENFLKPKEGKKGMNEEELKAYKEKLKADAEREAREQGDRALADEQKRVDSILAMGEAHGQRELAFELVKGKKSIVEAQAAMLDRVGKKQKPVTGDEAKIGLTDEEIRKFSLLRALRALAMPSERKFQEEAAFEFEVSRAAAQKAKKESRGVMLPFDIMSHRGMTVGTHADGGALVGEDFRAASFIELMRSKMLLNQAGAQYLSGLSGDVTIPRQTGAATAYHVAEDGAPTTSKPALGQVSLSPRTLAAYTDISRKLMLQSSIDVENLVKDDLSAVIGLAIDYYALYGTGSNSQPRGVKQILKGYNTASQEQSLTSTPTFAEVIALETKIASLNCDVKGMKYLINASMRGVLKGAPKVSGYPVYILGENMQMNGYDALVSNQIASGDIFMGNWNELIIGLFSGLDLMVDPYSLSDKGAFRVTAFQDYDVNVRHEGSFSRGNNSL